MANPKLRFSNNYPDWHTLSLKDFCSLVNRKNTDNSCQIPLTISSTFGLVNQLEYFSKKIASQDMSNYYLLKKGEFAYNKSYSKGFDYGSIKRLNLFEYGALSSLYICFSIADQNSDYMQFYFDSLKWYKSLSKHCGEGARNHGLLNIAKNDFFHTKINIAKSKEEQQKIAEFFTALDEKIRICESKINSTERLLAGLMDALFKQKIRLKNSEGSYYPDWRKSTIGKEGSFHYGKSAPKWSLSEEATTPCVRYGDLYTKFRYKIDSVNTFTNIDKKDLVFSKGGEVLVPRVGEDPNDFCKCAYLPFEGIAIGEMVSIYESQHDGMFLSFYFNSQMRKEFAKYVEGGNVSNLYYTYLEDIEINIPCLEEQKAISEFLTDVVNKLDFLKQSKQKYITLKKAFMQRMFV